MEKCVKCAVMRAEDACLEAQVRLGVSTRSALAHDYPSGQAVARSQLSVDVATLSYHAPLHSI